MGENSKIEWTHHTFNPWRGCTKVSAGCANCYAETQAKRSPRVLGVWGPGGSRVVAAESMWREPVKWNKAAACQCGGGFRGTHSPYCPQADRPRVFCASMADVFEDWRGAIRDAMGNRLRFGEGLVGGTTPSKHWYSESPCDERPGPLLALADVRDRLFDLIAETPNLDWLLLTKRPENLVKMLPWCVEHAGMYRDRPWPNVWIGTSVENQAAADERILHLLDAPALVRFLSCEPLLGPVDLSRWLDIYKPERAGPEIPWSKASSYRIGGRLQLVIVGGESGSNARPMHREWATSLRDQCVTAGVPFFFKQWGDVVSCWNDDLPGEVIRGIDAAVNLGGYGGPEWFRVGKKNAGRLLDGREWNELPARSLAEATA